MEKVKKTAEAQREKETNTLLDRLIARAGGLNKVEQMIAARRAERSEKPEKESEGESRILSADQKADLARGEKEAKVVQETRGQYRVDERDPSRVLTEIATKRDGATIRADYTYNDAGKLSRKVTEEVSGYAKYKTIENMHYDPDGQLVETHDTRSITRPGHEPMGLYRDVLYLADNDPQLQDPMVLGDLLKKFSSIQVKDAHDAIVAEYGSSGFSHKTSAGEYSGNAVNTKKQFTHDVKGRPLTEESYDGPNLVSRYSHVYDDRADGSYTRTRKDIMPNRLAPSADIVQKFDSSNRLIAEQSYNGSVYSQRSYTADGQLASITRRVQQSKDAPLHERAGLTHTEYTYDKNGRQETMTQKELAEPERYQ